MNTALEDVTAFLNHIVQSTNMKCMTPTAAMGDDSQFLAANLYAKSIFGEDALVNVSVENRTPGKSRVTFALDARLRASRSVWASASSSSNGV